MGGGASSLSRLRKVLLIRAYNSRPKDQTVSEQFSQYRRLNEQGQAVLTREDIKTAVGLTAPWFDELLQRYAADSMNEVHFESFVEFLETGQMPPTKTVAGAPNSPRQTMSEQTYEASSTPQPAVALGDVFTNVGAASSSASATESAAGASGIVAASSDPLYPDVLPCMGFKPNDGQSIIPHKGTTVAPQQSYRRPGPQRPLWRKRETFLQERIVQYTTVDAEGGVQELVETERSSTEILHMECKETGEFAHRESTEYEQTETFNKEVVSAEHGNEEYVHLKSQHDEYEHLESNMPKGRQRGDAEEGQPPPEGGEPPEPVQEGPEGMPGAGSPPMWQPGQPPESGSPGSWEGWQHAGGMPQDVWQCDEHEQPPMPPGGHFATGEMDEEDPEPQWWGGAEESHGEWVAPPPVEPSDGGLTEPVPPPPEEGGGADAEQHEMGASASSPDLKAAPEDDGDIVDADQNGLLAAAGASSPHPKMAPSLAGGPDLDVDFGDID